MSTITRTTAHPLTHPTSAGLRIALPPAIASALDASLAAAASAAPPLEVWAVGGAVRDLALGRPLFDLDLATSDDPTPLAEAAARALGGAVESHPRFGTASTASSAGRVDFARMRTETYASPGALPAPLLGAPIEADLGRRDFTVNAIALCVSGERVDQVLDPFAGLEDLAARRLRILHPASFADDATRIWRAARYVARLGLRPDGTTRVAIEAGARWLATISGERLWAEFERTAAEPSPLQVLARLEEWGVLESSAPGLALHPDARRALARRGPLDVPVLAAVVLAPLAARAAVAAHFGVPREVARAVEDGRALLDCPAATPDALAPLEGTSEAGRIAARWLAPATQRPLQRELRRWERTRAPLSAHDLVRLGVPEGPALGEWLRALRRARFLGTLHTNADARLLVRGALASDRPAIATKELP